jgi:hypothetical protein
MYLLMMFQALCTPLGSFHPIWIITGPGRLFLLSSSPLRLRCSLYCRRRRHGGDSLKGRWCLRTDRGRTCNGSEQRGQNRIRNVKWIWGWFIFQSDVRCHTFIEEKIIEILTGCEGLLEQEIDHRLRAGSTGNLNLTFMTVQINLWCFVVHMCEEIYATGV